MQLLPNIQPHLKLALLAAACAEAGDFEWAIVKQTEAVHAAPQTLKKAFKDRLDLYRQGTPYHRKPEWWR